MKFLVCEYIVILMEHYRSEAKLKYDLFKEKQDQEKLELDRREQEKREQDRVAREQEQVAQELERLEQERLEHERQKELHTLDVFELEFSVFIIALEYELLPILNQLHTNLNNVLYLYEKHNLMHVIQEKITHLIETINDIQKHKRMLPHEAKEIYECMKTIISNVKMDVEIQVMDTSEDEHVAQEFQLSEDERLAHQLADQLAHQLDDQLDRVDQFENEMEDRLNQFDIQLPQGPLPVCSINKRIGCTLVQLRAIAVENRIPHHGTKPVLALRLAQAGLVRII
jgi:hypothetical protein